MTTYTNLAAIAHSSDADYRAWIIAFHAALTAVGMVQTSDTGQVNTATVTRPATNTSNAYSIWRFDDTLQATAPIFIRFDFGTHASANIPRIQLTIGTGSNGSGTITGALQTIATWNPNNTPAGGFNYLTAACHVEGCFWIAWSVRTDASNSPGGCFIICRTVDASGVPDATGAFIQYNSATTVFQRSVRFAATAANYGLLSSNRTCLVIGETASNLLPGSDRNFYLNWMLSPYVVPIFGMVTVLNNDVAPGIEFDITPVGAISRHYYCPTRSQNSGNADASHTTNYNFAFIWE